MDYISTLATFSRANCVGICATLVPCILLLTGSVLWVGLRQGVTWRMHGMYGLIVLLNCAMVLHVASWFSIGVITPVTFILLGLALTCLLVSSSVWWLARRHILPLALFKAKSLVIN